MDKRWLEPILTEDSRISDVALIADELSRYTGMISHIIEWGASNPPTKGGIAKLTEILDGIFEDEREQSDSEPYPEQVIKTAHMVSVYLGLLAKFYANSARAFIVDYEVEHGGDS